MKKISIDHDAPQVGHIYQTMIENMNTVLTWNIFSLSLSTSMTFSGATMWKLTSRAFHKSGTFPSLEILNRSYGCSKSGQISIFCWQIGGVKKKHDHNFHIESAWN